MDQQNQPGKKGWQAAPGEMARSFEAIVGALPEVEMRKMFGCTCALVLGHMFAGLHERGVFMRLSDEDRATIESQLGATPFEPMPGRIRLVDGDTELLPGVELIETSGHRRAVIAAARGRAGLPRLPAALLERYMRSLVKSDEEHESRNSYGWGRKTLL
ncbi:MAG: TfoX/Sxy family protein [Nitrososphaerales archaeon]